MVWSCGGNNEHVMKKNETFYVMDIQYRIGEKTKQVYRYINNKIAVR